MGRVRRNEINAAWSNHGGVELGIDGPTIDENNGWQKEESAKGKMPRFSMRQRYTQIFQDLKHQLKFSLGI
jgi:hypothetical protein